MDLGQLGDYVKQHPKAAMAAAGIGGLGVVYSLTRKKGKSEDSEEESETMAPSTVRYQDGSTDDNYLDTYKNYPVINVTTPPFKAPSPTTTPPTKYQTLVRNGKTVKVTAGPAGICPPGYVSATQPGQPPRCTLANDANKKPGQRTSYVPSIGQTPYTNK
jgi:hypothetical protein